MLKYELLPEQLLHEGTATTADFFVAQPPPDEDILRVHDAGYYQRLRAGQLTRQEERATGFPWSRELFERRISGGASIRVVERLAATQEAPGSLRGGP